ncbi:unnamed protein product [Vicia faba]|uniref:Uncharacterized protein n=1 Tax=Vicia faba TaxID=3906 RepID=A0AAV0YMT2_VICFA|nr:unnamed protein product [Vicia faba]
MAAQSSSSSKSQVSKNVSHDRFFVWREFVWGAVAVYVPCEVIKQRMQVQGTITSWTSTAIKNGIEIKLGAEIYDYYKGMFHAGYSIWRTQGLKGLVQEYLDRLQLNSEKTTDCLDSVNSTNQVKDIDMNENTDSSVEESVMSVMEKVLQKRSLRMRNMQRSWQESPEGKKMVEFRKSLPSCKGKEGLLQDIACNQISKPL